MTSTCNTCTYMHRASDNSGQCKRYAPIFHEGYTKGVFPWIKTLEDWCGEYSGNTQPLTEDETQTLIDPNLMLTIVSVKPTPYRNSKDPTP